MPSTAKEQPFSEIECVNFTDRFGGYKVILCRCNENCTASQVGWILVYWGTCYMRQYLLAQIFSPFTSLQFLCADPTVLLEVIFGFSQNCDMLHWHSKNHNHHLGAIYFPQLYPSKCSFPYHLQICVYLFVLILRKKIFAFFQYKQSLAWIFSWSNNTKEANIMEFVCTTGTMQAGKIYCSPRLKGKLNVFIKSWLLLLPRRKFLLQAKL